MKFCLFKGDLFKSHCVSSRKAVIESSNYYPFTLKKGGAFLVRAKRKTLLMEPTDVASEQKFQKAEFKLASINVVIDKDVKDNLQKQLGISSKNKAGTYGVGLLGYKGFYDKDETAFVASNETTQKNISRFLEDKGEKIFENLRNSAAFGDNYSVSAIEGSFIIEAPAGCTHQDDFTQLAEDAVLSQQQGKKLVSLKKGSLMIGAQSSGNLVSVKPVTKKNGSLGCLQVEISFKRTKASGIGVNLEANPGVSLKDVLALSTLESLKPLTSTGFVQHVCSSIQKNFSISQVVAVKSKNRLSKSGLYVQRSLKGIENKLKEPASTKEAEALLLAWLADLEKIYSEDLDLSGLKPKALAALSQKSTSVPSRTVSTSTETNQG